MERPEQLLRKELGAQFTLKDKTVGPPSQNLGNKASQVAMENGVKKFVF